MWEFINPLRPRQNGRHFPDDIFKCIFLNGNIWMWIKISLKIVLKVLINNIPALVQTMAWHQPGNKPLSEQCWLAYWCIYALLGLNELNYWCDMEISKLLANDSSRFKVPVHERMNWHINITKFIHEHNFYSSKKCLFYDLEQFSCRYDMNEIWKQVSPTDLVYNKACTARYCIHKICMYVW